MHQEIVKLRKIFHTGQHMLPQNYQQTSLQPVPATQNPQGNVSSVSQGAPSPLQGNDTQAVLGQQQVRISVPSSGLPAAAQDPVSSQSGGGAGLAAAVALGVVLLALTHAFTLWKRRKQQQKAEKQHVQQAAAKPKKKPKSAAKKKRKSKHNR